MCDSLNPMKNAHFLMDKEALTLRVSHPNNSNNSNRKRPDSAFFRKLFIDNLAGLWRTDKSRELQHLKIGPHGIDLHASLPNLLVNNVSIAT